MIRKSRRILPAFLCLAPLATALGQIQFNVGGTVQITPRGPQPVAPGALPAPRPVMAPAPFDMTPSPEQIGLKREFEEIGSREGLTPDSIPKLIAVAAKQHHAAKSAHGEGHPMTLVAARTLVRLHHFDMYHGAEGEATWALAAYRSWRTVKEKFPALSESDHLAVLGDLITPLCNLGRLEEAALYVREAVPLFSDEAAIRGYLAPLGQARLDSLHASIQNGFLGLGEFHRRTGDLAAAEPWFKRAIDFAGEHGFKSDRYIAVRCLATVYEEIRDYPRAEPLRWEALKEARDGFGSEEHHGTAPEVIALGWNLNKQGRLADAERLLRQGLALLRKIPGGNTLLESRTASALADVLYRAGKGPEADALYREALAGCEKTGRQEEVAIVRFNQGLFLASEARLGEAIANFRRSIEIFESLGNPANDDFQDRALGELARAEWRAGEKEKARRHAREWIGRFDARLARVLSFTDEDQRLGWMHWQGPCDLAAELGMPGETARMLLRTKGVVLDSIMEDRALARAPGQEAARADWEQLIKVRNRLRQAWGTGQKPDAAAIVNLEARESELQSSLARAGARTGRARNAAKIDPGDVQRAIPADAALIDFFLHRRTAPDGRGSVPAYGVILQRAGREPKLVTLARPVEELDGMIALFIGTMHRIPASARDKDEALAQLLVYLHDSLIGPLAADLQDVATLIVSPDGGLHSLPFACLLDAEGRFLCDRFLIRQVNSARDLVDPRAPSKAPAEKSLVIIGGANYRLEGKGDGTRPGASGVLGFLEAMVQGGHTEVRPLPGARREVELLGARAVSAGWKADLRTGDEATEEALRRLKPPGALHIATHGFFLPRQLSAAAEHVISLGIIDGRPERLRSLFDPMQRSGLLLAGAEDTFQRRAAQRGGTADNDGVLSAAEAALLDLDGCWLVTLSACDTAAGDLVPGEGVLGLRRAFQIAGARNVLLTLWPIYDVDTTAFIDDFYVRAFRSGDAATALRETQSEWLARERDRRGLWEAIKRGGSFILAGWGR